MSAIFWTLVVAVLLSPLPLGAIEPWSWGLLGCITGALLAAWAARISVDRSAEFVPLHAVWPALAFLGAVVLWILLQIAPWTPEGWHHPNWALVGQYLGREASGRISINPHETCSALLRLLTFTGIFWLSVQLCRSRDRARRVVYAVAVAAFVYSAYGLVLHLSGSTKILWFEKDYYRDSLTSTFLYKNAFATFAGLGLICAIAKLIIVFEQAPRQAAGRRERTRLLMSYLLEKGWILIVAAVVIASALLLSNSRGGLVAAVIGILTLFATRVLSGRKVKSHANRLGTAVVIAGVALVAFGGGRVLDRFGDAASQGDVRAHLYELTLEAIDNEPWLGTGYGTFADTFQTYRTRDILQPVLQAHNTYLDNALGLGIPAAAALVLAVAWFAVVCAWGVRERNRDTIFPRIGIAALALVGTHAAMDFTIEIPAVAATLSLLLGSAVGQSWRSKRWRTAEPSALAAERAEITTLRV